MRSTSPPASTRLPGVVHLLFDPLLEAAAAMGAGLDWKTSLQELSAVRELGMPEYVIQDEGPDHMKTFTARVRVADRLHGHGVGRSKKEAEQQAAESAYRTLSEELPTPVPERRTEPRTAHPRRRRCLSFPRSRSSGAASRPMCSTIRSSRSRSSTPARCGAMPVARRLRGPADRPHVHCAPAGAASTSGCPSTTATPCWVTSA